MFKLWKKEDYQISNELDSYGPKEKRKTKDKLACWSNEGYGKSWTGVWPVAQQIAYM